MRRLLHQLFAFLALAGLLLGAPAAAAGNPAAPSAHVITDCTQNGVSNAIDQGGAWTFSCGGAASILFSTQKTVANSASLDGGGLITLSGQNLTRLFVINSGSTLTLTHLTVSHGATFGQDGGAVVIDAGGALVVQNSTFRDNAADTGYSGGAIFSRGALTISNSSFTNNSAGNGGALNPRDNSSSTTIQNTIFSHNHALNATNGWGGALLVWNGAAVDVADSQFLSNTAQLGGAAYVQPTAGLTLTRATITENATALVPGSTLTHTNGGGLFVLGQLVVRDSQLTGNQAQGNSVSDTGGALYVAGGAAATLTQSLLAGNAAIQGAGIDNLGTTTLVTMTLAGNLGNTRGGGVNNQNYLHVYDSTFTGNTASYGGAFSNVGSADFTNSTISENQSAFYTVDSGLGVLTLMNVTLADNSSSTLSFNPGPGNTHLYNTLLTSSALFNCNNGDLIAAEHSYSDDSTCAFSGASNESNLDLKVSPLGYHFGPTLTNMIAGNSPAKDHGAGCPDFDQRGIHRPQGEACDVGAVERRANDAFYWMFLALTRK